MNNDKAFASWRFGDRQFLAFPNEGGWHVMDEEGFNYGAYRSVDAFRKRQRLHFAFPLSEESGAMATCSLKIVVKGKR